ncbi:uncharacterized protein MJAP1_000611 [Malassezia japonica]|uniref:Uncharacterized protein n=1 Tax=Malassezia japonica TaxID=223818 RepID=A0AAF0J987_9BASI|nr:uncharacterized protein MJAP1_000611 [Malassezia japonica]WFD37664.1 hypothetical protein MJAP1_000611 [Malassezia japonica]
MPPAYVVVRRAPDYQKLDPTTDQRNTIIVACVYALAILLLWNIPILKVVLYPFKLLSVELDPDEGGATRMRGGIHFLTLPAGYLGSSLIGAILIACGFDERASKVASIVVGIFFLFMLCTWVLIIIMIGLFVLFWGVMNCLYSVWDICDDLIFRKVNESDATAFAKLVGCCPPQVWGFIWLLISIAFFAGGILDGAYLIEHFVYQVFV